MRHRNLEYAGLVQSKHDPAHHRRGGVVQMQNHALGTDQRFKGALNQGLTRLGEHLNRYVVGHQIFFDQLTNEVKFGLRG